jgi:putrescine aminotransferase
VREACIERGLMIRAVRDSLVVSPPLVMTLEEIDRMVAIIGEALDASANALRALG